MTRRIKTLRRTGLLLLYAGVAAAQDVQISGVILDPSKASVAGADIALRNEETGGRRSINSDEHGFYSFSALRPGVYHLAVRATGFETIVREGIFLQVGDVARVDFELRIGEPQMEVTVNSGPPPVGLEDAAVGTVIDRNLIDQMPLNGRGIQTLIELVPGVNAIPVNEASRGQFSINGQRSDANYFTVDGISVNFAAGNTATINITSRGAIPHTIGQAGGGVLPANNFLGTFSNLIAPDGLQEFKIQTSTYSPEAGHVPGGQINLVSRSGSNRFSGTLFEYLRNDKADANDWFNEAQGISKAPLRFNNFGGSVGGPLRLGRLYDGRNRTFFFVSVDQLFASQPQTPVTMEVPSLAARQSAPAALATFLSLFPSPNGPPAPGPGFAYYTGAESRRHMQGSYGLRIDHTFRKDINFFVRFNHAPSTRTEPIENLATPANEEHYSINTDLLTLGVTEAFTSRLVNEIRFGAGQQSATDYADVDTGSGAKKPINGEIFPAGFSFSGSSMRLGIQPAGSTYLGLVDKNQSSQLQFVDNLFLARGGHRWQFGGDFRRFRTASIEPKLQATVILPGIYNSDGTYTSSASLVWASIQADPRTAYLVPSFSAYAQDTWRISNSLTVTYGLRWKVEAAPHVTAGNALVVGGLTNLTDPSNVFLIATGKPFYPTTYANFAPRIGVAWRILGGPSRGTVLRSGAGEFFGSAAAGFEDNSVTGSVISTYTNPPLGSLFSGASSSQAVIPNVYAVAAAPHYRVPVTHQWNVTIEQALGPQTISLGYVGALGRRLIGYANAFAYSSTTGTSIHLIGNDASSSYNSMQVQFNRRLAGRLKLLVSYTWSHSVDDLSNDVGDASNILTLAQYLNPRQDRSSSDFDIRHSLHGAFIAELPSPRHGLWADLFGRWSAESIFFARSALPTDIRTLVSANGRPDYIYGESLYLNGPQYPGGKRYNPDAFADPGSENNGTLGRNVVRGFGAWQIDFALHREIRLSEGTRLQIRIEAFNILNHPNFANPSDQGEPSWLSFLPGPKFGIATQMLANGLGPSLIPGELNPLFQIGGPRVVQFALRFIH